MGQHPFCPCLPVAERMLLWGVLERWVGNVGAFVNLGYGDVSSLKILGKEVEDFFGVVWT